MTSNLPMGSSVYLIFSLINCLAFTPIAGAEDADGAVAVSKSHGQHATFDHAEAIETLLVEAVLQVSGDYALRIGESKLGIGKRNAMLALIDGVLVRIPLEMRAGYIF
jgi:hypothetical protein